MPDLSIDRPIMPSRASISLTKWPFPSPPIAGLHDISPILLMLCVINAVFEPNHDAAVAASTPACPPPTTTTSKYMLFFT